MLVRREAAGRRGTADALEFPGRHADPQGRGGTRRRLHRGGAPVILYAALRAGARRARGAGRRAGRRLQHRNRRRRTHRQPLLRRRRACGSSASPARRRSAARSRPAAPDHEAPGAWNWAATRRFWSSTMRTSTRRSRSPWRPNSPPPARIASRANRIYVQRPIYPAFCAAFGRRIAGLKVGRRARSRYRHRSADARQCGRERRGRRSTMPSARGARRLPAKPSLPGRCS